MTDKYRSREEIEGTITRLTGTFTVGDQLCLEVLLYLRDQQTEIIDLLDLLRNPPVEFTVADVPGSPIQFRMQEAWKPEPDTLFDEAKQWLQQKLKGAIINPHHLAARFELSYGRSSALMDALKDGGFLSKEGPGKPYRVV